MRPTSARHRSSTLKGADFSEDGREQQDILILRILPPAFTHYESKVDELSDENS
jgi:hypothetical protein